MSRLLRLPMLIVWLTAVWVGLWGDLRAGNVVAGLVVAMAVVAVGRPTGVTGLERTRFRPIATAHYAVYFLIQLVKSNLVVAWEIITPGSGINRAIIAVPMHTSSDAVITLIANSITLTPGTVTIDVGDRETPQGLRRTLYVHVLHFKGIEAVRRQVLELERLAVKAFCERDEVDAVEALAEGAQR